MIELANEQTISLAAAARMLPPGRRGRPVNISTLFRWITDGVRLPDGQRVRLEAIRLGARWLTSIPALERFAARQTPDLDAERPAPSRTPTARTKASEQARRRLEKVGVV